MKPSTALDEHREAIRSIILSHRARNPRVFGSAARGNDSVASDLDVLIDPTSDTTLFDIGSIRHALIELLGIPVDVVTPNALPARIRQQVLAEAVPV
jgi:predicted nucleotidyltransferase